MSLYHITIINRETKRKKGISEDSLGKRHTSLPTHGPVGRGTITTAFSGKITPSAWMRFILLAIFVLFSFFFFFD
jgi:hypothetical protein